MDESNNRSGSFFSELRRRKVIRTCLLYILVCWGALQVSDIVAPAMGFDEDLVSRYLLYASILGFPLTFALAWFFQFTSSGIVRTNSFVERRVLGNPPPINDRRRSGVSTFLRKDGNHVEHQWILSVETGPLSGMSYALDGAMVVGRSLDCDLAIVTPHVSRQHARLEVDEDGLFVEDLGSANGTVVNGKQAAGRQRLRHDDEVRLHDIIFRVIENASSGVSERAASSQTTFIQAPRAGD